MTEAEAELVHAGDLVAYQGRHYRVVSVKLGGVAGPHFRLSPFGHDGPGVGLTSYMVVRLLGAAIKHPEGK